jgi:hypothetical protein
MIKITSVPFHSRTVRRSEVDRVIDGRPIVIVSKTPSSTTPIWGLTPSTRTALLQLLEPWLADVDSHDTNIQPEVTAKRFWRIARIASLLFVLTVVVLIPFLDDGGLNGYWRPFGVAILLVAFALFLLLIYAVGMAVIHWQAGRELREVERQERGMDRYHRKA